jgi:hypothetical protein
LGIEGEATAPGPPNLLFGEDFQLAQAIQHPIPAPNGGIIVGDRVKGIGRGQNGRQSRSFGKAELAAWDPEIELGGSLKAVDAVAQVNIVEVESEDFVFAVALFQLQGGDGLPQLAPEGVAGAGVVPQHGAGQLLADGAAPLLHFPRAQVHPKGAGNAQQIHPKVGVKAVIFSGDHHLGQNRPKSFQVGQLPVGVPLMAAQLRLLIPGQDDQGVAICGEGRFH